MPEYDKEKLKKEIVDLIPEQKDYDEKFKNIEEMQKDSNEKFKNIENTIKKAILTNDSLAKKSEHEVLDEFPHAHETKHEHRVHSYDKFCPDCGKDNPDFNKNQYTCSNCGEEIGTKEEAQNAVACPHCGKNEGAESSEEGWTI